MNDMAEETEAEGQVDEENGEDQEAGPKKKKLSGKFLVLFVALPVLVLGAAGYFGAGYFGLFGGDQPAGADAAKSEPIKSTFYDLPEMLVNLNNQDRRARYLKLKVSLEMTDEEVKNKLPPLMPRILDTFQIYLRELRAEDLDGSAGVYRLKEELTRRVNLAIKPRKIDRVLFKEILVQ